MRQGAEERDFDWAGTLYADRHLESNHIRVLATVQRTGARAVFLPSVEHLDKRDIDVLASHVPVYCVADGAARSIFTDDPDPTCAPPVTKIAHTSSKSPKRRRARSTQG